jgi:WD40 repeat protein
LALSYFDGIYLLDLGASQIVRIIQAPELRAETAQFTPDGAALAVLSISGTLRFHDAATGKIVREAAPNSGANCFVLSPDGQVLATGHPDGTILLWELSPK